MVLAEPFNGPSQVMLGVFVELHIDIDQGAAVCSFTTLYFQRNIYIITLYIRYIGNISIQYSKTRCR
jgi:hypothetical protein